jgi:lipopolysaccharide export system permease protein
MFLTKIWERYFFKELFKTCIFFITCFYGLYVLIDYSSHTRSFHHASVQFQWFETVIYYGCEFVRRVEVLLPFAILIATIRTLCKLNMHHELVALMSSGLSLKMLMRPFLLFGLFCTCLMFLNTEFLVPIALKRLNQIDDTRSRAKRKQTLMTAAQHIALEDGTTLIFQNYDTPQSRFFDTYWIRSINDIYRIKYLYPNANSDQPNAVLGQYVDHLKRNSQGKLITVASFEEKALPEMHFNPQTLFETITLPEELALSELWDKHPSPEVTLSEKEAQSMTIFYRKLLLPWLCLLAVIAPAPFCLRFTRYLPLFFIYAGSIFGLVAIYLAIDAAVLLGKGQILSPFLAVWPLFIVVSSCFTWRFIKVR